MTHTAAPVCGRCGQPTVTVWLADDELWREFNGGDDGIACTDCFVRWAVNEKGVAVRFRVEVVEPRSAATALRSVDATWSDEVDETLLLYVYAPGRRKQAPSRRQATAPAQAIFDYDGAGNLLGVEVIATVPE